MHTQIDREKVRRRIRYRIRKKVTGSASIPRVAVFRSSKHIYAQAIDDLAGTTIAAASSRGSAANGGNIEAAKTVGEGLAAKLKEAGVKTIVFDRGGKRYHGRVKALADAMREAGLKF